MQTEKTEPDVITVTFPTAKPDLQLGDDQVESARQGRAPRTCSRRPPRTPHNAVAQGAAHARCTTAREAWTRPPAEASAAAATGVSVTACLINQTPRGRRGAGKKRVRLGRLNPFSVPQQKPRA